MTRDGPASGEVGKRRFYRNGWVMFGVALVLRFVIQLGCAPWLGADMALALGRGASLTAISMGMSGHDEPLGAWDAGRVVVMMAISFAVTFYFSR
jgi:hypothetical protein